MTRYWEPRLGVFIHQVMPGELFVTEENIVIGRTVQLVPGSVELF